MLGSVSCETEDDETYSGVCDKAVIVDKDLYNEVNTENYNIRSAVINGDCLEIEFFGSGCDGSTWEMELVDSGAIEETGIIQRNLRMSLKDEEDCEAAILKKIAFDLTPLKTNDDQVILNLENWEESLLYEY